MQTNHLSIYYETGRSNLSTGVRNVETKRRRHAHASKEKTKKKKKKDTRNPCGTISMRNSQREHLRSVSTYLYNQKTQLKKTSPGDISNNNASLAKDV